MHCIRERERGLTRGVHSTLSKGNGEKRVARVGQDEIEFFFFFTTGLGKETTVRDDQWLFSGEGSMSIARYVRVVECIYDVLVNRW